MGWWVGGSGNRGEVGGWVGETDLASKRLCDFPLWVDDGAVSLHDSFILGCWERWVGGWLIG